MVPENDDQLEQNNGGSVEQNIAQPSQNPDKPASLSLHEMNAEMFQTESVKRLFLVAKAIGDLGADNSIPDDEFSARELMEKIKHDSGTHRKCGTMVEMLLNGILSGKFKEEEVEYTERNADDSIIFSLNFHLQFGKSKELLRKAVRAVIENKILHNDPNKTIDHLTCAAYSPEMKNIIELEGEDFRASLNEEAKKQRKEEEESGKAKFAQEFIGEDSAAVTAAAQQPRAADASEAPEAKEQEHKIIRATLSVHRWNSDEEFQDGVMLKFGNDDPEILPGKSFSIPDENNFANVCAEIEIVEDKIVLVTNVQSQSKVIDLENGVPIHTLEIKEGNKTEIQVGNQKYRINIVNVERTHPAARQAFQEEAQTQTIEIPTPLVPIPEVMLTPVAPAPLVTPVAPPSDRDLDAAKELSRPSIETREAFVYNLSAVFIMDADDNIIAVYPCLDQKFPNMVTVGTDPSNDIMLPEDKNFKPFNAEIKFLAGEKIFVNGGKDAFVRFKGRDGFIATQPVRFTTEDTLMVGEKDKALYFKAEVKHPFTEPEIFTNLSDRLIELEKWFSKNESQQDAALKEKTIHDIEKHLKNFNATLEIYKDKLNIILITDALAILEQRIDDAKQDMLVNHQVEQEAKMSTRRHFDADGGETSETPRPFKYAVLFDNNQKDKGILHIIFPPAITVGSDKVNTFEVPNETERGSKYEIQPFECTFIVEDEKTVRMVIDPRTSKQTRIYVDDQMPGTVDGKTHELDMLRPPLTDGKKIQIETRHYTLETSHEFTENAIKPYVAAYLSEIMEALILYEDHGDKGDKRNARETLDYFKEAGLVTEQQVSEQEAIFLNEKLARQNTGSTREWLKKIRGENEGLDLFQQQKEGGETALPYDVNIFNAALEIIEEPSVRWEETGWTKEECLKELSNSAKIRLKAYDKQLLRIRLRMQAVNVMDKVKAFFSKEAEEDLNQQQIALKRGFKNIVIEMISLVNLDVPGPEYKVSFLNNRMTAEEYQEAEKIFFAQNVIKQLDNWVRPSKEDLQKLMDIAQDKTYGDFFNAGAGLTTDTEADALAKEKMQQIPMQDFVLAKIKALGTALLEDAREMKNVSENLADIEYLIEAGFLNYQAINSSEHQFKDLRHDEEFFKKQQAGEKALAELTAHAEPDLEEILDFDRRLSNEDFSLSDEKEEEYKQYCRGALEKAVQEARVGNMTLYFGILTKAAIRRGIVKTQEIGTTADELENLHETAENMAEVAGMMSLIEEVHEADVHNLHPLLKLKEYIEKHEAQSLIHKGKTGEEILEKLVTQKIENMFEKVFEGKNPGLIQMIVDDMRQFGLEPMMKKCVAESVSEAINALWDGTKTVNDVRPFFATLRLINLGEILDAVRIDVVDEFLTQSFNDLPPDFDERSKKFTEELETLGLYN